MVEGEALRSAESALAALGISVNRSAWNLTGSGEPQQHVIPAGESRMHFAFLWCWCGAERDDDFFVEHTPHG